MAVRKKEECKTNNHASTCNTKRSYRACGLGAEDGVPGIASALNLRENLDGRPVLVDVEDIVARLDVGDVTRGSLIGLQNVGHQVNPGELRPYRRGRHRRG